MNTNRGRRRFAVVLSWINIAGLILAFTQGEMMHAAGHVAAGIALYAWIRRMDESARDADAFPDEADASRIEGLESDVDQLRRELSEAQERLDFTERMLARQPVQGKHP